MNPPVYCEVCTLPPEYCEFGGSHKRCRAALEKSHPELYETLYGSGAVTDAVASLSIEKQKEIDEKVKKQVAKEEAKEERKMAQQQQQGGALIQVNRIERNKRKHVILIKGLDVLSTDNKALAKTFASKFATGASVTKDPEGKEEIIIQGDVGEEVEEYLLALVAKKKIDAKVELSESKKR